MKKKCGFQFRFDFQGPVTPSHPWVGDKHFETPYFIKKNVYTKYNIYTIHTYFPLNHKILNTPLNRG